MKVLLSFLLVTNMEAGKFLSVQDRRFESFWKERLATPISVVAKEESALDVIKFVCHKARIPGETAGIRDAKISMTLTDGDVRHALKQIHDQTGYEFSIQGNGSKLVISAPRAAK